MLKRKITEKLSKWKTESNKALLVTGARQVGKSFAIRDFGTRNYSAYFEANLILDDEAKTTLIGARNAIDFINRVTLLNDEPLIEGDTLIFIDEIQEYPQIVTLIKALVEDGRYSYAFSGSMLGTEFKGISSFPVGFVKMITMRPMDFEEFCWAIGVSESVLSQIRFCLQEKIPVEDYIHEAMLRNFRAYMVAGGMPEVVQSYVDDAYSLNRTRSLQTDLVSQYAQDISKYAGTRAFEVRSIYDQIPVQLDGKSHRFAVASLKKEARYDSHHQDFLWLVNAGVGLRVAQVTEAKSPLRRSVKSSLFKLYQSDTGMLVSRYPQSMARAIYLDMRDPNLGGLYENVIAQELTALGIEAWYYQSDAVGEFDFVIEGRSGRIVPLEVKSGKKVRSHAAIDKLLQKDGYKIRQALVLSRNNLSVEGKIVYAPLYMSFCLDELTDRNKDDFTFAPTPLM